MKSQKLALKVEKCATAEDPKDCLKCNPTNEGIELCETCKQDVIKIYELCKDFDKRELHEKLKVEFLSKKDPTVEK